MNRLWVQLSLAFGGVVLVVMFSISLTVRLSNNRGAPTGEVSPEVQAYFEQGHQTRPSWLDTLTGVLILVTGVAIAAGAWTSHRLTTPLSELERAAQALGQSDLSQRVTVHGARELRAVGLRFNEMAEQLEKEELLRRNLLADVAHELRHPLHIVRGSLQAILDGVYPLSHAEIARLLDQTYHLNTLVDDLHALAQAEAHQLALQRQPTDMAELVMETASAFNPLAAARAINLRVELLGAMPTLNVDAARLRQALNNLLGNALRHTPESGRVTVRVVQSDGELCISVEDSGSGIAAEHLPYVFDRFYRTDGSRSRNRGGTGLGLAIVRAIMEAHGGRASAVSPGRGQGSVFSVYLPAA